MHKILVSGLLASTALIVMVAPTYAAAAKKPAPPAASDPRIGVLQQELRDVQLQLREIKGAQGDADTSAPLSDLKRSASTQYAEVNKRLDALPKTSLSNGRLSFASADGGFTLALRALVQFDAAYFAQGRNPAGVDLNSGTNFRRAQLGFQGTVYSDWAYNFIYDFGGNGVENRGYIYNAYIEFDGFRPFYLRAGAYTPSEGLEDQTGSGDLFFLERASASDVARNLAGAPSREAISAYVQGDTYLASVSYTGKKSTDGTSTGASVGTFDSQEAVIGRAAWLAVSEPNVKWLIDGHITEILKLADAAPSPTTNTIRFSNGPENGVDASRTVDTGSIDASRVREFGFESAGEYGPVFAQGGLFRYEIQRRIAVLSAHFTGWYGFLTYSLTGEQHPYDPATASFRNIRPAKPLGSPGGWGAWEATARYSSIDLDFLPSNTAATGGIPGGKQDVWALGLNWYPNNAIKFQFNYENLQVNHVNAPGNDISANIIGLRSQIQL